MYNFNGSKRKKTADCTHIVGCYRCNGCYNTGFSADLWVAALEKVIVYVKIQGNAKIILKEEYEEDKLYVKKIRLKNFRGYEGCVEVDLIDRNNSPALFNVIYAPNGVRKTTYLMEWNMR